MYNHHRMGSRTDLFGQLWKEYALSDSRYLTSDPFVLCMETITAVRSSTYHWVALLITLPDFMGSVVILDSRTHHKRFSVPASYPSPRVSRPILRRFTLLHDLAVR